ncbi:hypothetical protein [Bacillus testis]|uniref:hypothetical protein n=1 Tax=Bacillus testis TaxID=1622072 RepID=UPI000AC556F8|nr:hypothetical protein [Bacillus testis]
MEAYECTLFTRELNRLVNDYDHCDDQSVKLAIQSDIALLTEALSFGIKTKEI